MDEGELDSLKRHPSYVAGFTDPSIEARGDMYDLFMNGEQMMHYNMELVVQSN